MQSNKFYTVEITKDGSPTLFYKPEGGQHVGEHMHHSSGAATETRYVYGEAINKISRLRSYSSLNCLVVGLGLGYIEILIALVTEFKFTRLVSFEKDQSLIDSFVKWVNSSDLNSVYDQVFQKLVEQLNLKIEMTEFKQQFGLALSNKKIHFYPCLQTENIDQNKFNLVCYDAFSKKINFDLWSFNFLNEFILSYCDNTCVFATYAKTGDLNRALKQNHFEMIDKKGFSNKRDCTLAVRA